MKKCFLLFISMILLLAGCKVKPDQKDIKGFNEKISIDISEKIDNISITSGKELLLGKKLKKQHYNSTLTKSFPQYFLDSEDTGEEELIYVASKSGSMDVCRNDGGIVSTPYGKYVIVLFNKNFTDPIYYPYHPAAVFGSKVSSLI